MINTTIGQYSILEKLGEGGMGVVYKAKDTKLDRFVALKFLPPHLNASDQDKARFTIEAKAAASLNHPNVCSIIDIQEHDGQMFIVMEFVDGVTLREKERTMSFKQAIDTGIQIADGLAAAHEKGIVHRDIKPENIMVRKDGIAQIMDFGLAKLRSGGSRITRLTKEGSTVGTAGYMSPEQIQGQEADHRSDIFSLGVLLYELFSGQLPFRGAHETALMYEIVNVDAEPMSGLRPEIDAALDAIVLECLAKEPAERFQSVAEVAKELRRFKRESSRQMVSRVTSTRPAFNNSRVVSAIGSPAIPPPEAIPAPATGRSSKLPWILCGASLVLAFGVAVFHFLSQPAPIPVRVTRSMILAPNRSVFNMQSGGNIAISPDGNTVAFVASDTTSVDHVWARPINSLVATMLAGTDGATYPFWSPDSRTIGFFAGGKLKKIESTGGPVLTICDVPDGRGASWSVHNIIVFCPGPTEALMKVPAAGGVPTPTTVLDTAIHESGHRWPFFLPDGSHFIYTDQTQAGGTNDNDLVKIGSVDSLINRELMHGNSNVEYANGRIIFIRQGTLMAQPFDVEKLVISGDAVPIAEQVQYNSARSKGMFAVSQTGVLILQSGESQSQHIGIFDRAGNCVRQLKDQNVFAPVISPDGARIAFYVFDQQARNADIWIDELARGVSSRFTFIPAFDANPLWTPQGDSIVFSSTRKAVADLFIKSANGNGEERLLIESPRNKTATDWSRDGRYFAFTSAGDPKTKTDIWIVSMKGDRKPVPFAQTEFNEVEATFSPDGRWVAYASDETGKPQVYARLVDGTGGKFQISTNGGRKPFWRSEGKQLFYTSTDRKFSIAYVREVGPTLQVDSISTLFDFESRGILPTSIGSVSTDAKAFVTLVTDSKQISTPITLVVNWEEELKKKP